MFLEDSDFSVASAENTKSTGSTADLETLQYLNNKDTNIKSLNAYHTIKKMFQIQHLFAKFCYCGATVLIWEHDF